MLFLHLADGWFVPALVSAPRCTPPIPPVEKTLMPARCATAIVPETVVPPSIRCRTSRGQQRNGRTGSAGGGGGGSGGVETAHLDHGRAEFSPADFPQLLCRALVLSSLPSSLGEVVEVFAFDTDLDPPVQDRDRRRGDTLHSQDVFALTRERLRVWRREPWRCSMGQPGTQFRPTSLRTRAGRTVGDQGALEGDDRLALGLCLGDFWRYVDGEPCQRRKTRRRDWRPGADRSRAGERAHARVSGAQRGTA